MSRGAFYSCRKIENFKFLSSDAETAQGKLITHPHVGVAGADGTIARARCARAGAEFDIFVVRSSFLLF